MTADAATGAEGPDPLIGRVLDERYRIETALGQGGIGRVYKARHLILGRHIALKVLLAQYESIPVLQERFRREAEALAALSHPNIVTVTDFGVAEGMPYLVMELLEGEDLAELVHREMLDPKRGFNIMRQVLRALAYAHSRDLVHRDLKPHNVFVRAMGDGTDHVTVLDFGLARFMGDAANRGPKLTKVGALIGTPAYMAPEQASGEAVDARADVYAAGLVLFETLSGRRPFDSNDPGEILRGHLLHAPPRLGQVDTGLQVSDALEALIARSLSKSPADRYQSAAEMLAALDALGPDAALRLGPRPPRGSPIRSVAATQGGLDQTRAATPEAARLRPSGPSPGYSAGQPGAQQGAQPGAPPASSIHLPKSKFPLMVGVGCAGGLLVGAVFTIVLWFSSDRVDDAPPAPTPTEQSAPPSTPEPAAGADPPQEPTQTVPVPTSVCDSFVPPVTPVEVDLHRACQALDAFDVSPRAGGALSVRETSALRAGYRRDSDARRLLLAAHCDMTDRRLSGAFPVYETAALQHPEDARRDTRMRTNLIEMACASTPSLRRKSRELMRQVYGADAIPAVRETLARSSAELVTLCRNADGASHLETLIATLEQPRR